MDTQQVARICHEANRAYCSSIGDNSQTPWDEAPDWQKKSAINGVEFHAANLKHGIEPSPSASHEAWLNEKRQDGWRYGPVKDIEKKEHPCFMPFDGLPVEQRMKDYLFSAIVKTFYAAEQVEVAAAA